ncbi:MAG: PAS domain S-box protein, partial [Vicinamibacterales bacterium]
RARHVDAAAAQARYLVSVHLLVGLLCSIALFAFGLTVALRQSAAAKDDAIARLGRLAAFVEASEDAVISRTLDGVIVGWNAAAARIFGYSAAEVIGQPVSILVPPDRREEAAQLTARFLQGQAISHVETERVARNGRRVASSLSLVPLRGEGLEWTGAAEVIRDITSQKQTEDRLRMLHRNNEDLRSALDQHGIVAVADRRGRIVRANDNFCAVSKYSREELIGQDHRIVNSGHHPRSFWQQAWNTIASGRVWSGEVLNRAKDGSEYWVDTTIVPFLDERGKPYQYISIRHDITRLKQAEASLQAAADKLRSRNLELVDANRRVLSANQAKSDFLATMSHEIRTPMNTVLGMVEILEETPLSEEQHGYLRRLSRAG